MKKYFFRLCKVWVIRGLRLFGILGRFSLFFVLDLFFLREEDMVEIRDRRVSRVDVRGFYLYLDFCVFILVLGVYLGFIFYFLVFVYF